ncbi:MAG: PilZ domain-containing protein [Pseudomonadota bacterium]
MNQITMTKRNPKRSSLFVKAWLKAQTCEQEVRIRNLSVDGALLEGAEAPQVFETFTLSCGSSQVNGIVVWAKDGRIGVEFSEPVQGESLLEAFQTQLRVSAPKTFDPAELS